MPSETLAKRDVTRWTLRRKLGTAWAVIGAILIAVVVAVTVTLVQVVSASNDQIGRYNPALVSSQSLLAALVNQETGVRGYALSRNAQFLDPYRQGIADQEVAVTALNGYVRGDALLSSDLQHLLNDVTVWHQQTAELRIAQVKDASIPDTALTDQGDKARFDAIRTASTKFSADLQTERNKANERRKQATAALIEVLAVAMIVLIVVAVLAFRALSRWVVRPLSRLQEETRIVASGQFDHVVSLDGAREFHNLAVDVEAMRLRITSELEEMERARREVSVKAEALEQSNADLEQFAYVASHDLQEPLRKVSNFCQLLERQYGENLDDRARQYIGFAVDGARRMQTLIQDLLEFSRVGRSTDSFTEVNLFEAGREAVATLEDEIATAGAVIELDPGLPTVMGDQSLLVTLIQNLVGNAVKYRGEQTPEVRVKYEGAEDGYHTISVTDNGIGIDPSYAERIFVIFQRLHLRDQYAGTGIGLSICKKIVEYHQGKIWLDLEYTGGARFWFTLPIGALQ